MENFIVSARKYRPSTFDTVVGQQSITNTLKNAINNNHLAQAFLFCGPRGVGKTTCARILAKTINCLNITEATEACDNCDSCQGFNDSHSFNIHELDAASNNGVDKIRDLVDQVRFAPQVGKHSIYIIDEVHMLSQAAFNAFLKTLEEPPAHAIFILATTEKHKIIPTILSRCQIFDFKRIQVEDIVQHLEYVAQKEGITAEHDALHIIAQKADGALRDALSIFDQIVSFCGNEMTYDAVIQNLNILDYDYFFKVTDSLLRNSIPDSLNLFNNILNNGFDGHNFINGLGEHFRNLLVCQDNITLQLLEVGKNIKERYQQQSAACPQSFLLQALELCNKADLQYRNSKNQRLLVEITLMQLCGIHGIDPTPSAEKKTFVVKSTKQKENKSTQLQEVIKTPSETEETTEIPSAAPIAKPEKEEIAKQTIVSLKDRPKKRRTISINPNHIHAEEEKVELKTINTQKNAPFTKDDLSASWKNYATKTKLSGKHNLYSILSDKEPLLQANHQIELVVDNKVQEEVFTEDKSNLLRQLKDDLQNDSIQIIITVKQLEEQEMKAYTPEDKFKKMVEQNPVILDLKNQFDLELDY